jgi:hypothetical protein
LIASSNLPSLAWHLPCLIASSNLPSLAWHLPCLIASSNLPCLASPLLDWGAVPACYRTRPPAVAGARPFLKDQTAASSRPRTSLRAKHHERQPKHHEHSTMSGGRGRQKQHPWMQPARARQKHSTRCTRAAKKCIKKESASGSRASSRAGAALMAHGRVAHGRVLLTGGCCSQRVHPEVSTRCSSRCREAIDA